MESFAERVPQLVLCVVSPLLGACILAWVLLQLHSFKYRIWSKLGRAVCAGLVSLAIVCTSLIGKNTNGVNGAGGMYLMQFNPPVGQTVTPEDISNGWRVAEVSDAGAFAPPPANVVTNERWRLRGAYDDAFRIPTDGWSYPSASGVTVLSRGEIRRNIRSRDFPRAFEQDLSLLPVVNWQLLPDGRNESAFWHGSSPSNTLIATWWNAALGRDATNPVCFQAELYTNGGFDYRYEDRTVHHVRVWSFDWDDDGLENSVDPDPLVAGPDAHGTNAEWYNTVCSNEFSAVEGGGTGTTGILPIGDDCVLSWREGVNSNAYYFVDVVTTNGPAPIYFTGDRESRLGNPVVVARTFETNHVPLLIGIDYAITSPVPFMVSFPVDYTYPIVETNAPCRAHVRWPLNFVFTESIGTSNRVYTVSVEPYDPGGVLEWTGSGGGVPMRGGAQSEGCDCVHYGFDSVFFTCSNACTCCMGCTAEGCYHLEDASFLVKGGQCRCGFDDPPPDGSSGPHDPDDPPSLTISFSKPAVIFEDAYEYRPDVTEPRRSTRVRLTVDAYGGTQGGTLWLTGANMSKLTSVSGSVPLPYSQNLAAGESYHATGIYEGVVASGSAEDVRVSGTLTTTNGVPLMAEARLTSVRILLKPDVDPPEEGTIGRHEYGVCELVEHHQYPTVPAVTWNTVGGGSNTVNRSGQPCFQFPLYACENPLRVELNNVSYVPRLTCIEPDGIKAGKVELCTYGLPPGKAGGIGLLQEYYVTPLTVSFSGIAVEEVPCDQGTVEGYFRYGVSSNRWSHTRAAGAGKWYNVSVHNRVGEERDIRDEACLGGELFPVTPDGTLTNDYSFGWMDGSMVWQIPYGWNVLNTVGETEPFKTFGSLTQEFYIDDSGCSGVRKFGNQALRLIDDRRFLGIKEIFTNTVLEATYVE